MICIAAASNIVTMSRTQEVPKFQNAATCTVAASCRVGDDRNVKTMKMDKLS